MKRGFVMVVLLAIVAAMTVVLSGVLISNQYSSKIALREADDLKARNVAELCLSKGVAVAVAHFRARGGDEFDFDGLLDPDEVSGNSDDYVFANVTTANTRVIVPASAAGTATEPLFRYAFERIDPDGAGPDAPGGCYLRFDDNADDNLPGYAAQTGNTGGVAEGTGVNVNNRDRDASIVVTAIGIYPAFTTTADADAYGKAHARVTMKQYFSASPAPAIYGNGDINVGGNTEFCGTGGLRGVDVNVAASSCVCGDTLARSVNGSASTSAVDECGVSRCPRVAGQNDVSSLPNTAPFTTDFTEQCLIYSETLGENPSAFRITDPVAPAGRAPTFDANNLRVHLREDGAVFVWDGRSNSNALAATVSNTPCDGFPPVWPPANSTNTPANNTAKDAICSPLVDGGQGGFYCPITGDPFDKEFCRRDAIHTPGNPTAVPPVAPVNLPAVTSTTRCDRLNVSGTPADQSPIEGNNAAKNALCTTAALGQPAVCTSSGNPLDRELCTPPGTFVSCSTSDANELPLSPAQWASFTSTDITTLEATHCFSNGRKTDGSVCTPLPGALQPQKLCWRMVADLDGTAETDSRGTAEWEAPAGARALQIPAGAGALAAVVPNLRGDGRLTPTNLPLTAVPTATVLNIGAQETTTVAQPTLRWLGNRWATESGWLNSNVSRRMPRPTQIRVAQTAQEPVLTLSADTRVGGVRWLVRGGVEAPSGTVTLAHRFGQAHANYAGGSTGCTMENAPFNAGEVNTAMGQDVLVATGRISVAANAFTAVGRLVGEGGLLVQTPADRTCLVGGLSFGGFSGGCGSATACDQPGVCFENRVAVIGSVLAEQDLAAPRGIFAQRGNGPLKISQLMSRRNVCINGSSRVVGQIVSERLGGTIDVGPDLLMLQSGEVGVGFATRKTTWNDTSW